MVENIYGQHSLLRAEKINSNWIQLYFNSTDERKKLEKAVSFYVPGYEHSAQFKAGVWDGTKCFLTKTDRMRTGIFKAVFPDNALVIDDKYSQMTFDDIPLFKNKSYERRGYQLDAIKAIFTHKYGIISSIMGSGKTLIAASAISYHLKQNNKGKVLFVVYDRNILNQSVANFTGYGFKVTQFGDSIKDLSGDIVVATIQSLSNLEDPKSVLKNITFLICDEAHHSKARTSKEILNKLPNCHYRIGLTATPYKNKTLELAEMQTVTGPVIFEYGFDQAIEAGSVVPVKCFFLNMPLNIKIDDELTFRRNYKVIWDTAISENIERNTMIAKIISMLTDLMATPVITNVDRVLHGQELAKILKQYSNIHFTQMYGSDDIIVRELKKEQLQDETLNCIVSSVLSEGVDFPISPVVAINASGRKSFIKLIQFLGRITRKNEAFGNFRIMIDFINLEHKFLKDHSEERIQACRDFGCDVVVCDNLNDLLVEIVKYYKQTK